MDLDKFLESAAKWILPFIGLLWVLQSFLGLNFSFGFTF